MNYMNVSNVKVTNNINITYQARMKIFINTSTVSTEYETHAVNRLLR